MLTESLNGQWMLEMLGEGKEEWLPEPVPADIPGSVYGNLLEQGRIPDPYYRDNELRLLPLMEHSFSLERLFVPDPALFDCEEVILRFEGIDTLADIYLNGTLLGRPANMHRTYEYAVRGLLRPEQNRLQVILHSPIRYIREENQKVYTGGSKECMEGFPHLRKAHCMFGWDWGPRIPDAGIFRNVTLLGIQQARIGSVYIKQEHEENCCTLDLTITLQSYGRVDSALLQVIVTSPEGEAYRIEAAGDAESTAGCRIRIPDPKLWWPNGYGEQPLYRTEVLLLNGEGKELDRWERRIGLRRITVNTEKDTFGNCFAHEVNGVKIFAMGADYIPEDNLLSRVTGERTEQLLRDAVWANHNCIRVWGGGYYCDDFFYDLCDELGLLVWQDFMFACASYELDDAFEENVRAEVVDNVRRLRHHACLGLWCGNNEMETQTLDKTWNPSIKQKYDYIKLFEYIIPGILKEEDPETFYWPSSPSSGGNYDDPWDENRGDTHYWDVWHGNKPFTEYRKYRFRYLSEFGFQSFPCLKTVESFTLPEERNIFSRVMEMHQRNRSGNGKILEYLSATYLYPKDFEHLLYASQLLQADAIRYGVEHFRRYRGRCMGAVVWQLNDIWPVASWASIDYYGRWKALHYAERKMFAPVLISCEEIGELSERPHCIAEPAPIEKSARLHVANETLEAVSGTVKWQLRNPKSEVIRQGEKEVSVPALDGIWLEKLDFSDQDERKVHLAYQFEAEGKLISGGTCLFTPPKHYYFEDPLLQAERKGNRIYVTADCFAKNVAIEGIDGDVKLSDNYFDMEKGTAELEILEGNARKFQVMSVYDIA